MQHRVEHGAAPPGQLLSRAVGFEHEHRGIGDHRQPFRAVAVQHVPRRAVQHPLLALPVRGDPAVDRGAGCPRVEPVTDQRGELAHGRQERGGIGRPPQFFENDRQLDGIRRVTQLGPAVVDVGLPDRGRIHAVLGDTPDQRRRTLLADGVPHGFLPEPLIGVEFQQHPASSLAQLTFVRILFS